MILNTPISAMPKEYSFKDGIKKGEENSLLFHHLLHTISINDMGIF